MESTSFEEIKNKSKKQKTQTKDSIEKRKEITSESVGVSGKHNNPQNKGNKVEKRNERYLFSSCFPCPRKAVKNMCSDNEQDEKMCNCICNRKEK